MPLWRPTPHKKILPIRQELKEKPKSFPHPEQRSRWRPSAAVRQRSMARMTLCCGQEMRARLRSRNRWAKARKISATSRAGRFMKPPAPVRSAQPDRTSAADWAPTSISAWTDVDRSWCRADRRGRAEPESPATRHHCRAYGWRSSACYVVEEIGGTMYPPGLCRVLRGFAKKGPRFRALSLMFWHFELH